jgi:hypothetical protein
MNHKDDRRINAWLKDLRGKEYIEWIYSTDFIEKTKPAIYYLNLNGIRCLKQTDDFPIGELRKRYKENSRSRTYIDHCLLIADCCITLRDQCQSGISFTTTTQTDYTDPASDFDFLTELGATFSIYKAGRGCKWPQNKELFARSV